MGLFVVFADGPLGVRASESGCRTHVFMAGSEKPMSDMLLEELITEMATRLEDSSIFPNKAV